MITVACVLRSGGIYTPEWVRKLRDGVRRHMRQEHRFVCLSDRDVPCERITLETAWPGWWSKIELFRPGLLCGPTLYLDLDSVIVGSLDQILDHPHDFTMAHEFHRPGVLCSTAMAWQGDQSFIFDAFAADPKRLMRYYDEVLPRQTGRIGDQAFIEDQFAAFGASPPTFLETIGPVIVSFKVDCQSGPPPGAAVVAFHGSPKPNEFQSGWVAEAWT